MIHWISVRQWVQRHAVFLTCISAYFVFFILWLGIYRPWSAWLGGDYQSLNTLRFWLRDGFFTHFGLFLTQGYSPFIKLLEQPDLWHHALSSVRLENGAIAQSIYYNHYPTQYLLPLYWASLLLGQARVFPLQLVQLGISFAALVTMYAFLVRIVRKPVQATLAIIPYSLSWLFTDFAFNLNNIPLDDLLRWLVLLFLLLEKEVKKHTYLMTVFAWLSLFLLAAVSLDSVLFCAIWLVLTDLAHKPRWSLIGRWILFASATILPHIAQFAQSVAAWGQQGAINDMLFSFQSRSVELGTSSPYLMLKQRIYAWGLELHTLWLGNFIPSNTITRLALLTLTLGMISGISYLLWKKRTTLPATTSKTGLYTVIAFICGLSFAALVPVAGYMLYEGRQFVPCAAFLILFTFSLWEKDGIAVIPRALRYVLTVLVIIFSLNMAATGVHTFVKGSPTAIFGRSTNVEEYTTISRYVRDTINDQRHVLVLIDPDGHFSAFSEKEAQTFAYQISPGFGYEADMLILASQTTEGAVHDVATLRNHTKNAVIPLFVAKNQTTVIQAAQQDRMNCQTKTVSTPSSPTEIADWFILSGADCQQP